MRSLKDVPSDELWEKLPVAFISWLCPKAAAASTSFQVKAATGGITVVPQVQPVARTLFTICSIAVLSRPVATVLPSVEVPVVPVCPVGFTSEEFFWQEEKHIAAHIKE